MTNHKWERLSQEWRRGSDHTPGTKDFHWEEEFPCCLALKTNGAQLQVGQGAIGN